MKDKRSKPSGGNALVCLATLLSDMTTSTRCAGTLTSETLFDTN